jgi:hypothetical protein
MRNSTKSLTIDLGIVKIYKNKDNSSICHLRGSIDSHLGMPRGLLHEYIQQWLSILAPKEKIGYTWDMLDAVWLEDKAKPGFIKALAEHGFNLISSGQWSLRFDRYTEQLTVDVTLTSMGPLPR